MKENMTLAECLTQVAEENQTRKILLIVLDCKTIEEAIEKIKALLY